MLTLESSNLKRFKQSLWSHPLWINLYLKKDFILQRTNGGVHKDDIEMLLNGTNFKSIASQGQRKSLLFALKLAEFELLKRAKNVPPILLLDDVFEKLDNTRMHNL